MRRSKQAHLSGQADQTRLTDGASDVSHSDMALVHKGESVGVVGGTSVCSALLRLTLSCLHGDADVASQLITVSRLRVLGGASPVLITLQVVRALVGGVLVEVEVLHGDLSGVRVGGLKINGFHETLTATLPTRRPQAEQQRAVPVASAHLHSWTCTCSSRHRHTYVQLRLSHTCILPTLRFSSV
jgi:hypothetical protein